MSGLTASNLPVVCGAGAVTCSRSARKRAKQHRYRHPATASWWTERNLIPQTIEAAATPGRDAKEKVAESARDYIGRCVLFQLHRPWTVPRGGATQQHATAAASSAHGCTGLPRNKYQVRQFRRFRLLM
jgi:hypothetical protein